MDAVGRRRLITCAAVLGWAGLGIQMYLVLYYRLSSGGSLMGGLMSYFSYFTVLTNIGVATVLTCAVTERETAARRWFLQPWVSSGVAVSIVVVSLGYNVLLRSLFRPEGVQIVADELLHDIMPLVYLVYWWGCVPKGTLQLRHVPLWLIYPVLYFAYALLRGHLLSAYPYWFLSVSLLGYPQVFINAGGILLGFVLIGLLLIGLDRTRR
ncbi:hypothetical protein C2E19_23935 [Pseudomonas sp. DTU12.3]|uniref:Pr6Pr family membrane protein n=1 Tax=Pseudomonas sp. DTU12.3 TaxID=2073078 RepID=UPI001011954B|nr:Pr6Pr family membrane protein [Pseudomonas sp. DTU12.3]QAX86709.1 hypothetical protein C2E19_23935 [Pseudomonas sp. DTU12.3]